MKTHKIILLIIFAIILICIAVFLIHNLTGMATAEPVPDDRTNITIYFFDVGQGDSIFIDTNETDILIDTGTRKAGPKIVQYLRDLNITKIDAVIITHNHDDHYGGLGYVITNISINQTIKNDMISRGTSFNITQAASMTVLNAGILSKDENDNSIVIRLKYYRNSVLFMGDCGFDCEQSIMDSGMKVSADIIKIGHHGSGYSSSANFLDAVKPKYAVISVGAGNSYGHPTNQTLARLAQRNIKVYRTDMNGTVKAMIDGINIKI